MNGPVLGMTRRGWRYVLLRRSGDIIAPAAVIATATLGIWAGVAFLFLQIIAGFFTDVSFLHVMGENGNGGANR